MGYIGFYDVDLTRDKEIDFCLLIRNFQHKRNRGTNMRYLSTFEAAAKWGLTPRRVGVLCNENRIPGVQRAGSRWIIPEDAEKPADARIKSGKYIKSKAKPEGGLTDGR